ncbi:MAG: hypothetical protein JSV62_06255 [Promethearchaeota archaeon]|nr:MAG: hypothetical protein JSV62_06255 [Candidatus Lokiarchaeota archaeon]
MHYDLIIVGGGPGGATAVKIAAEHGLNSTLFLFEKTSSTPLWNYTIGGEISCIVISENGAYIVASESNSGIYLLYNEFASGPSQNITFTVFFMLFAIATALNIILIRKSIKKIKIKN